MATFSKTQLTNLHESKKFSRRKLKPFREKQLAAIKEYVGFNYSDDGANDKVPVNLIELAMNIYLQHLIAHRPQVLITTAPKELKAIAANFELDLNWMLERIKFGKTLHQIVMQAMFSVGIAKTGLNNSGSVMIDGQPYDIGEEFTDSVSLDNWVHDMTTTSWDHIQYCGDRYTLPLDMVKESPFYSDEFKKKLSPKEGPGIEDAGEEKAETVTQGNELGRTQYKDTVELWDIWLPLDNLVITIGDDDNDEVGRVIEWNGPKSGPYRFLTFNDVPDNIMPLAPVALWIDLHKLENKLFNKLGRQADRQKTIVGVRAGADADGNRVVKANDGDVLKLDDPKNTQEYKFGGIDQESLLFFLQVKELAVYFAGNLDALGGLSRMSETVGQDQLLTANASKRLESMQKRTIEFTKDVVEDLAWYRWTDPIRDFPVTKRKHGAEVATSLTVVQRETNFLDYNFEIEPYSMQHQTPASRLAALMQIFTQLLAPLVPMMEAQGITIDFEGLLAILSKYSNLPELHDLLIYTNPEHQSPKPVGQSIRQSPVTTRNYVRQSKPGATRQGQDNVMAQLLAGGKPQRSERAMLGRPVS